MAGSPTSQGQWPRRDDAYEREYGQQDRQAYQAAQERPAGREQDEIRRELARIEARTPMTSTGGGTGGGVELGLQGDPDHVRLPEKLQQRVDWVERDIADDKVETLYVLLPDGSLGLRMTGTIDAVPIEAEQLEALGPGAVLTHNHPGGGPLSREDIITALTYEAHQIRAVSLERTCVFQIPRWPRSTRDKAVWITNDIYEKTFDEGWEIVRRYGPEAGSAWFRRTWTDRWAQQIRALGATYVETTSPRGRAKGLWASAFLATTFLTGQA